MKVTRLVSIILVYYKYARKWNPEKQILFYLSLVVIVVFTMIGKISGALATFTFPLICGMILGLYMIHDELQELSTSFVKNLGNKILSFSIDQVRNLVNFIFDRGIVKKMESFANASLKGRYVSSSTAICFKLLLGIVAGMILYLIIYAKKTKTNLKDVLKRISTKFYVKIIGSFLTGVIVTRRPNFEKLLNPTKLEKINTNDYDPNKLSDSDLREIAGDVAEAASSEGIKTVVFTKYITRVDKDVLYLSVDRFQTKLRLAGVKRDGDLVKALTLYYILNSKNKAFDETLSVTKAIYNVYTIFCPKTSNVPVLFFMRQVFGILSDITTSNDKAIIKYISKKLELDKDKQEKLEQCTSLTALTKHAIKSLISQLNEY